MERLINYLKENNIEFIYNEFGFAPVLEEVTISNGEKRLFIYKDEDVKGDCKYTYQYHRKYYVSKTNHCNFEHLTNTTIRIFLETH